MDREFSNILLERLPVWLEKNYALLGIPFGSDEKEIQKAYDEIELHWKNHQYDFHNFCEVTVCYKELLKKIKEVKEILVEEENLQKLQLNFLREIEEYKQKKRRELELFKGPLWVTMEGLKNTSLEGTTEMILGYVKDNILLVLEPKYHDIYLQFLGRFQQLWGQLYEEICLEELEALNYDNFDEPSVFSVGIDELIKNSFSSYPLFDNYQDLFDIEEKLTNLIPDNSMFYFLESHLDIVTKNLSIQYEKSDFIVRIYSFIISSRIEKLKRQYYHEKFERESLQGITGVVYIDNNDLREYIKTQLNLCYGNTLKKKK